MDQLYVHDTSSTFNYQKMLGSIFLLNSNLVHYAGIHTRTCKILFSCPYPAAIFQIGTDIIYILSCVRDFKQQMLTTAIQDGMLEVCVRVHVCVWVGGMCVTGVHVLHAF